MLCVVAESVASSLDLILFPLVLSLTALPPPLVITNMFPIVTLTSFETMSELRSAVLICQCRLLFQPKQQQYNISLSLSLRTLGRQRSAASGSAAWLQIRQMNQQTRQSQYLSQTYNVDCQSEHSYRLIFLPLCQSNALFCCSKQSERRNSCKHVRDILGR